MYHVEDYLGVCEASFSDGLDRDDASLELLESFVEECSDWLGERTVVEMRSVHHMHGNARLATEYGLNALKNNKKS